jgi:hypothetical protein
MSKTILFLILVIGAYLLFGAWNLVLALLEDGSGGKEA